MVKKFSEFAHLQFIKIKKREINLNDLKELGKLMKERSIIIVTTLIAMVVGAILGAITFYHEWLG